MMRTSWNRRFKSCKPILHCSRIGGAQPGATALVVVRTVVEPVAESRSSRGGPRQSGPIVQIPFSIRWIENGIWWRRWESNPRPRNFGCRFLRVQPAVKSRPAVGQQAAFRRTSPKNLGHRLRARRQPSPSNNVNPRLTGGTSGETWLLTQPVRSRYWQLKVPNPFNEWIQLDTLPTTETVPRRTQYAPRLNNRFNYTTAILESAERRMRRSEDPRIADGAGHDEVTKSVKDGSVQPDPTAAAAVALSTRR